MPIPDLSAHDNVGRTYQHVLGTDTVGIVSPTSCKIDSGSFVAEATSCMLKVEVSASTRDGNAASGSVVFAYGDNALVSPPLLPATAGGSRTNVTVLAVGNVSGYPDTVMTQIKLTGLTVGHTYNWEIGAGIVGYSDLIVLPDTPIAMSVSLAQVASSAVVGAEGDRIIGINSATKLHIIKQNHFAGIQDQLLTGSGMPLTAGRSSGAVAISPNGLRAIVTNYALNTVSLYDLTNPALPVKIGADLAVTPSPWAAVWQTNDIAWIADLFVAAHVQKLSGLSGASPAAAAAITVDGATTMSITQLSVTPDGTKLLVAGNTAKTYVVNTSTNAVTSATAPVSSANFVSAIDNTTALLMYGTGPTVAIMTFSSMTFGSGVSNAAWGSPQNLYAFGDGRGAMAILAVADTTRGNIRQIVFPSAGCVSTMAEYTNWAAVGTPACSAVDEHGNIYVCTTNGNLSQWYGSQFNVRPSFGGFFGEKVIVQVTPAH